jgi:hypothetical protein
MPHFSSCWSHLAHNGFAFTAQLACLPQQDTKMNGRRSARRYMYHRSSPVSEIDATRSCKHIDDYAKTHMHSFFLSARVLICVNLGAVWSLFCGYDFRDSRRVAELSVVCIRTLVQPSYYDVQVRESRKGNKTEQANDMLEKRKGRFSLLIVWSWVEYTAQSEFAMVEEDLCFCFPVW